MLYVDVDNTLVLWDTVDQEKWKANTAVIDFVRRWALARPDEDIVIWSSGGLDYARTWGERLLGNKVAWEPMAKGPRGWCGAVIGLGDVTIDDAPFDIWKRYNVYPDTLEVLQ